MKILATLKTHAYAIAAILAALIILTGSAYVVGRSHASEAFAKEDAKVMEQLALDLKAVQERSIEAERLRLARDRELISELQSQNAGIRDNADYLKGQLYALDRLYDNYKLTVGDISLLNDARRGGGLSSGDDTTASGEPAYADTTPGGLTVRDLKLQSVDDAERYNTARNQCNALIDWVEENLIDIEPEQAE